MSAKLFTTILIALDVCAAILVQRSHQAHDLLAGGGDADGLRHLLRKHHTTTNEQIMKGKIEDIDSWTYDDVSNMLEEAGLRTDKENKEVYLTEEIDAVEVISVLESWYDVEVSMSEHMCLAKLMRRGFIGRAAMLGWLKRCNYKPVRKMRTHDMPLFEGQITTSEAIDVLTEFNRWRRGEGKYAWNEDPAKNAECPYSPKAIGQAIDIAINEMKKGN